MQQRQRHDLGGRERPAPADGRAQPGARRDGAGTLAQQAGGFEARPMATTKAQRQVDVGAAEVDIAVGGDQPDLAPAEPGAQRRQARQHPQAGDVVAAGDGERPVGPRLLQFLQHRAHMAEARRDGAGQPQASLARLHRLVSAAEQGQPGLRLQIGDMSAHRRLRDADFLGRPGQAAVAGGAFERHQGVQQRQGPAQVLHDFLVVILSTFSSLSRAPSAG